MSAQDRTLDQYQELMHINAASHLIRAARKVGLLSRLREGQHTLEQLCDVLSLLPGPTELLLDGLVAIGIIEKYEDDYALSRAAHLLCQYDDDLGDRRWDQLAACVRGEGDRQAADDQLQFNYLAATQWIHTPAAMQAAEILNIGGEGEVAGPKILDLGCGSAVWSCAMAHRDPQATITAVDQPPALEATTSTAASIGLSDRLETIQGDPQEVELAQSQFDLVLLAQRLGCLGFEQASHLLARAMAAAKGGGRVVVIDLFRGPARPNLAESIEALKLELSTRNGQMRSLHQAHSQLQSLGLEEIQFTFLAASRVNMGIVVGVKPTAS
jgi:ubiquinone/menaquinone biosynthesis C-methylase UbiE